MSGDSKKKNSRFSTMTSQVVYSTLLLLIQVSLSEETAACSYNGNGSCNVKTELNTIMDPFNEINDSSINWKIRPQNIGFMYYLKTTDDGKDLGVRGIVKWKVQLKNWTPNDTVPEGFLISIMEHDTNETVESYELTVTEPFEKFVTEHDVMEYRLELDNVLKFDKRYDAKINILPIGKQAAASSFLSIMGKLEGQNCSAMTGLAERWAPHVMVDVFETTSEIELSWQPAPSFLCIKTYEIILQNRDGVILNVTDIEVDPNQKIVNATFGVVDRDQLVQVKVRGKNAMDGGCACVNCNCITDKTKFFMIPSIKKTTPIIVSSPATIHEDTEPNNNLHKLFLLIAIILALTLVITGFFCCRRYHKTIWKQQIVFSALKTPQYPNKKTRAKKCFKVMLVCPEISGRDHDYMMRIADAMRKSNNHVVCDRFDSDSGEAEQNMLHWVYIQTQKADKIVVFHSSSYQPRCGIYDVIINFFPCNDRRLAHIALTPEAQKKLPNEVEYVLPRDHKLLEEAYDISIAEPLVIDIPNENVILEPERASHVESFESIADDHHQMSNKTDSTDSGVSSMSSNSSDSGGATDILPSDIQLTIIKELDVEAEAHPLLQQAIEVL